MNKSVLKITNDREEPIFVQIDPWADFLYLIKPKGVIHHSDRGSQYLSIRYTERLSESGFNASVGSVGDSYDNALAESINALFKAEVIHKNGPWKSMDDVERATLTWVDWYNQKRLLRSIDDLPPAEYEMLYYKNESCKAA